MTDEASQKFELIPEGMPQTRTFSFKLVESETGGSIEAKFTAPSDDLCPACLAPLQLDSERLSCSRNHVFVHKECAETVVYCPFPECGEEILEEFPLAPTSITPVKSASKKAAYRCPACFDDVADVDAVASCEGRHFYVHLDCLEMISECPAIGCNKKLAQVEKIAAPTDKVIRLSSADVRPSSIVDERLRRRQRRRERLARLREPLVQQRAARRARQLIAQAEKQERYRRAVARVLAHKKKMGLGLSLFLILIHGFFVPSYLPTELRVPLAASLNNKDVLLEIVEEESGPARASAIAEISLMNDLSRKDIAIVCSAIDEPSLEVEDALSDFIEKHKSMAILELVNSMCRSSVGQKEGINILESHRVEASRAILKAMHHPTIHFDRYAMRSVLIDFQDESIPVLIDHLNQESEFHKGQIVEILQEIGPAAEPSLLKALDSNNPQVRKYALRSLKLNSRTRVSINAARRDPASSVREEAARILRGPR